MRSKVERIDVPGEVRRKMTEVARDLRKHPTRSEAMLWQALRGKKLNGIKFRRQQAIGPFVVDFYASTLRLIVEVDGPEHEGQVEEDRARQTILENAGYMVMRVETRQVETNLDGVWLR